MKPQLFTVHWILFTGLLAAASLHAQVSPYINYQGKLVIDGEPLNLPKNITFKIYDKEAMGNLLWFEDQPNVERTNGIFNVRLGRFKSLINALTNKPLFSEPGDRYLELQVGSKVFTRIQITSVAYALKANSANALDAPDGDPTNAVFVNNNGNVGIGTANPGLRLHVNGFIDDIIRLSRESQSQAWHIGVGGTGAPGSFFIARAELSRDFNIDSNGNVGIGTAAPTEKLVVDGNIRYTGNIGPLSSRKFKENITDLSEQEALTTLAGLDPVKFNYKTDKRKELQLGFIAEDVPELVATSDRQAISTMNIIAVLTKVLQEQQKEIAALREEVNVLKQQQ